MSQVLPHFIFCLLIPVSVSSVDFLSFSSNPNNTSFGHYLSHHISLWLNYMCGSWIGLSVQKKVTTTCHSDNLMQDIFGLPRIAQPVERNDKICNFNLYHKLYSLLMSSMKALKCKTLCA